MLGRANAPPKQTPNLKNLKLLMTVAVPHVSSYEHTSKNIIATPCNQSSTVGHRHRKMTLKRTSKKYVLSRITNHTPGLGGNSVAEYAFFCGQWPRSNAGRLCRYIISNMGTWWRSVFLGLTCLVLLSCKTHRENTQERHFNRGLHENLSLSSEMFIYDTIWPGVNLCSGDSAAKHGVKPHIRKLHLKCKTDIAKNQSENISDSSRASSSSRSGSSVDGIHDDITQLVKCCFIFLVIFLISVFCFKMVSGGHL